MSDPRSWIMPVPRVDASGGATIVTSWYGDGRGHVAIDLGASDGINWGTPVLAPIGGYVENTGYDGPYNGRHTAGRWLWFVGDDGSRHKFFHTAEGSTVPLRQHVNQGQQIARVGNSGTIATHLHWEVHGSNWSSPRNFDADVRWLLANNRWYGVVGQPAPPVEEPPAPPEAPKEDEDEMATVMGVDERNGCVYEFEKGGMFKRYVVDPAELDLLASFGVPFVGPMPPKLIDARVTVPFAGTPGAVDVAAVARFTADEIAKRLGNG